MKYEIVKYPNPILRQLALEIPKKEEIENITNNMFATMFSNNGVGLAAPQVGLAYRLFVMKLPDKDKHWVVVNPNILSADKGLIEEEEGCLSIPGIYAKVNRHRRIKVEFLDQNGKMVKYTLEGLASRVFQHEIEHLYGILFLDKLPLDEREKLLLQYNHL